MRRLSHPHDHFFRWVFLDRQRAASLLQRVLPADVAGALRWERLCAAPESLIDEALQGQIPDLHFEVPGRRPALLRLLLHHQSTVDRFMALRLLGETTRLLERWRQQRPRARLLPWVLPVVVHHGPRPWRAPTDLRDLLAAPASARQSPDRLLPSLPFLLYDLAALPEAALDGEPLAALALRLLKHAHQRDLWQRLPGWQPLVQQAHAAGGPAGLNAAVEYMFNVCRRPPRPVVRWLAETIAPEEHPMFKSWAQELWEEGEAIGIQKGEAIGIQKGEKQGREAERRALLLHLLSRRFGELSPSQRAVVEAASPEQIARWIDDLFVAPSLSALLGG